MTKGISIKAKAEAYDGLKRENDLLNLYLYDMTIKDAKPDATGKFDNKNKADRVRGDLKLYRATAPHGGYVVITGEAHVEIHYLEDAYRAYCVERTTIGAPESLVDEIRQLYWTRNTLVSNRH